MTDKLYAITHALSIKKEYLIGSTQEHREDSKSLNPVRLGSGLQNCVREELAAQNRVAFSLLMDCAIRYSFDATRVTINDILAMTQLTAHTIQKALKDHLIKVTIKRDGRRGAPTKYYHIPDRETVRKLTTPGNDGMSDHLPEWALESVKSYRMARYKMLILRGCKYVASEFVTYSREFLSRIIGVSKSTLIAYEQELEMIVIHNIQQTPITKYNANQLAGDSNQSRAQGAYLKIENNGIVDKVPAIRSLAHWALNHGATVTLFQYLPNTYSVGTWTT